MRYLGVFSLDSYTKIDSVSSEIVQMRYLGVLSLGSLQTIKSLKSRLCRPEYTVRSIFLELKVSLPTSVPTPNLVQSDSVSGMSVSGTTGYYKS